MSSSEERQAKALEAIAKYLNQLVPVFKEINKNLAEFVKMTEPKKVAVVQPDLESAKLAATHPEGPVAYVKSDDYAAGWTDDPTLFKKDGE